MNYIIPLCHTKICPCFIFYDNNKKINIDYKVNQYIKREKSNPAKINLSIECNKYNCSEIFLKY